MYIFKGCKRSELGRKTFKMWNYDTKGTVRNVCTACDPKICCGSEAELMNHMKNKHPKLFESMRKKFNLTLDGAPNEAAAA